MWQTTNQGESLKYFFFIDSWQRWHLQHSIIKKSTVYIRCWSSLFSCLEVFVDDIQGLALFPVILKCMKNLKSIEIPIQSENVCTTMAILSDQISAEVSVVRESWCNTAIQVFNGIECWIHFRQYECWSSLLIQKREHSCHHQVSTCGTITINSSFPT